MTVSVWRGYGDETWVLGGGPWRKDGVSSGDRVKVLSQRLFVRLVRTKGFRARLPYSKLCGLGQVIFI